MTNIESGMNNEESSKFNESQIVTILKLAENGMPITEVCRSNGVSSATFYKWRAKYGGMDISMLSKVKQLEAENSRLKRMYAELQLDHDVLKGNDKKVVKPSQRKLMAKAVALKYGFSIRRVCSLFHISETTYHYVSKLNDDNERIAKLLLEITSEHRTCGFQLCYLYIRNVLQLHFNHKRIYRIYCELCLNLRIKPKGRVKRERPEKLAIAQFQNHIWSMDFMHDNLMDGRKYRTLNIIDDYNREALESEIDFLLPSTRVIRVLNRLIECRSKPFVIRCDNGSEYISDILKRWAKMNEIELWYIQPGNPQQNGYVERFNRTMRYELLNQCLFENTEQVKQQSTQWIWMYNNVRPHMANGGMPPVFKK